LEQRFAEIGMRDGSEPCCAFAELAPAQIGDAIFGDDDVGVAARAGYRPAVE
jgi:hypothetical protein